MGFAFHDASSWRDHVLYRRCKKANSRFWNRNYNLVEKHRQHNIHVHAGMMTIIQNTNQPNLIQPQDTIPNVDRFQSDPMCNMIHQSPVQWYIPSLCPNQTALTHFIQINMDRIPYRRSSIAMSNSWGKLSHSLFINLSVKTHIPIWQIWMSLRVGFIHCAFTQIGEEASHDKNPMMYAMSSSCRYLAVRCV